MTPTKVTGNEISKNYKKSVISSKKSAKKYLLYRGYSYNLFNRCWKCDKRSVDYETIFLDLLQWSRANNQFREHGLFAKQVLSEIPQDPDFTGSAYIKSRIVRQRGSRVSGKRLFSAFCKDAGIEIIGTIEAFMVRNNHIVKRFYDYLANHLPNVTITKCARIFSKLCSSVFSGIALRTKDAVEPKISFEYTFEPEKVTELSYLQTANLSAPPSI